MSHTFKFIYIILLLLIQMPYSAIAEDLSTELKSIYDGDKFAAYEQAIQNLTSRMEALERKIDTLERNSVKLPQNNSTKSATTEMETIEPNKDKGAAISTKDINNLPSNHPLVPTTEKELYDLALANFKDDNISEAEKMFDEIIQKYPNGAMASSSYYWKGKVATKRSDANNAALNYLKAYKNSPKGQKAPDALLELSSSLGTLGKVKEACTMLLRLDKEFPERPANAIKRSKELRDKYGCKK